MATASPTIRFRVLPVVLALGAALTITMWACRLSVRGGTPPDAATLLAMLPRQWQVPERLPGPDAMETWRRAFAAYVAPRKILTDDAYERFRQLELETMSSRKPYAAVEDSGPLDDHLARNATALALFDEGIAIGRVAFPDPTPKGDRRMVSARELMQLKQLIAKRALRDARPAIACEQAIGCLRLGAMWLDASHGLIDDVVGHSFLAMGISLARRASPTADAEQLDALAAALAAPEALTPEAVLRRSVKRNVRDAAEIGSLDAEAYAASLLVTVGVGELLRSIAPKDGDDAEPIDRRPAVVDRVERIGRPVDAVQATTDIVSALAGLGSPDARDWRTWRAALQQGIDARQSPAERDAIDRLLQGSDTSADPVADRLLARDDLATRIWLRHSLESLVIISTSTAKVMGRLAVARAACIVQSHQRRHGAWPERLDAVLSADDKALADPLARQAIGWDPVRRRLWSVGIDGEDDGGAGDPDRDRKEADIVWDVASPDEEP